MKLFLVPLILLLLLACGQDVEERTLAASNPQGTVVVGVLANRHTPFKEQVLPALYEKLGRKYTLDVRNIEEETELPPADAYLIMDALWVGGRMNDRVREAYDKLPAEKVVLFITAGDSDAIFRHASVDAITSASDDFCVDEAVEALAVRLREILEQ